MSPLGLLTHWYIWHFGETPHEPVVSSGMFLDVAGNLSGKGLYLKRVLSLPQFSNNFFPPTGSGRVCFVWKSECELLL